MKLIDDAELEVDLAAEHRALAAFVGEWKGTTRVWLDPKDPPQVSEQIAVFRPILGGSFIHEEYESFAFGQKHKGYRTYGFEIARKRAICSWIDNVHMSTGMMHLEGAFDGSKLLSLSGPAWRTVVEVVSTGRLKISQFNVTSDGEMLGVETVLDRV